MKETTTSWIYHTNPNNRARFTLGIQGESPLICIGVNPSTATPGQLDGTLQFVERHARLKGFDSWLMLNLYPQRATNPNNIHKRINNSLHQENLRHIQTQLAAIGDQQKIRIWAAWGTLIEKRPFLNSCLEEIFQISCLYNTEWIRIGPLSKAGHPRHPLYLSAKAAIKPFDINTYLKISRK
ncbi:MAG: DUF1643 domain-containing protein [Bacteroidetes bacterium]|nr:DUF1643 domain-containing protein [Bacteroidota bacterium]